MKVVVRTQIMTMLSKTCSTIKTIILAKWPVSVTNVLVLLLGEALLMLGKVCQSKTACYICNNFRQLDKHLQKFWVRLKSGQFNRKLRSIRSKTYQIMEIQRHTREQILMNVKRTMKTEPASPKPFLATKVRNFWVKLNSYHYLI